MLFDIKESLQPAAEVVNEKPVEIVAAKEEPDKAKELVSKLVSEHECGICYELLHQPVQLAPCLHIFCGGCLSDWFKKQKDCPKCRKKAKTVTKSFQAQNMITMLL